MPYPAGCLGLALRQIHSTVCAATIWIGSRPIDEVLYSMRPCIAPAAPASVAEIVPAAMPGTVALPVREQLMMFAIAGGVLARRQQSSTFGQRVIRIVGEIPKPVLFPAVATDVGTIPLFVPSSATMAMRPFRADRPRRSRKSA